MRQAPGRLTPIAAGPLLVVLVIAAAVFPTLPPGQALAKTERDGGTVSALNGAPTADLSVPALAFGTPTPVPSGSLSTPQAVTVSNNGSSPLQVSGFSFGGASPEEFLVSSDTCRGPVPQGDSCVVNIRFAPQAEGSRSAQLTVLTNAASDPVLSLSGEAGPPVTPPVGPTGPDGPAGPTGPAGPRPESGAPTIQREEPGPIRLSSRHIRFVRVTCPEGTCRFGKVAARVNVGGKVWIAPVTGEGSISEGGSRVLTVHLLPVSYRMLASGRGRLFVTLAVSSSNGSRSLATLRAGLSR